MEAYTPQDLEAALNVLRNGGLILYPTDTIWGIGCDATNAEAVKKVYALKQRDDKKSLIVLLADEKDVFTYVSAPPPVFQELRRSSEKPTTFIFGGAIGLPSNLIAENGSIAIRWVEDPFCKALIKRLRNPLVSTSANISGEPSPRMFKEVSSAIRNGVDYIVTHRQQEDVPAAASRILRFLPDGTTEVIRP